MWDANGHARGRLAPGGWVTRLNPETKELHLQITTEHKTGTKITGILGRKGLLDKTYYQNLHLNNLEAEPGYKIFMFHTTLSEMKPKHLEKMESYPVSSLVNSPKNNYSEITKPFN